MNFRAPLVAKSITQINPDITRVATITIIVDCCNCVHVGQVTFSVSSL